MTGDPPTPEQRVEALFTSQPAIDALLSSDVFALEKLVAGAIREAERAASLRTLAEHLAAMTPEQRCEVFAGLGVYCKHCGRPHPASRVRCQCWNDE